MKDTNIAKLQRIRQITFPDYQKITLDRLALRVVSHLFLNPDCRADIDLFSLPGKKIRLADLGQHIITAAPSTLAKYAQHHHLIQLGESDILRCFALDHADDIKNNQIDRQNGPAYALAHLLNISRLTKIDYVSKKRLVTLHTKTTLGNIIFKKVLLPTELKAEVGNLVYHHFGVVVAVGNKDEILDNIYQLQLNNIYFNIWQQAIIRKNIIIDFSDAKIFSQNVVDNILHPQKIKSLKQPQDIKKGKIKFQK